MDVLDFPDGIYLVDFEFYPAGGREGNLPTPVCMVVREWPFGRTERYWRSDLQQMSVAPFPTGEKALFVAYYACVEMDCFHVAPLLYFTDFINIIYKFIRKKRIFLGKTRCTRRSGRLMEPRDHLIGKTMKLEYFHAICRHSSFRLGFSDAIGTRL